MRKKNVLSATDVVIGRGIAGTQLALSLARRGRKVLVVANGDGATAVSSGLFDLGPGASRGSTLADAWSPMSLRNATQALLLDDPAVTSLDPQAALATLTELGGATLPVATAAGLPFRVLAFDGTFPAAWAAQAPLAALDGALRAGARIGVVGSRQLRLDTASAIPFWAHHGRLAGLSPSLEPVTIELKGADWTLEQLAARFGADEELKLAFFDKLEKAARESRVEALLLPPVFLDVGPEGPWARLQSRLGIPMGEFLLPGSPVPGERLRAALARRLEEAGIPVVSADGLTAVRHKRAITGLGNEQWEVSADRFALATGKYLGGGVRIGYVRVREPLFDLPLFRHRTEPSIAYRRLLPLAEGHPAWAPIGAWGDATHRPRNQFGERLLDNVYVTGTLLGGVDFRRRRLGLGFLASLAALTAAHMGTGSGS
jgi:anaerobic glycerol-3-phosphate dehydrogenase